MKNGKIDLVHKAMMTQNLPELIDALAKGANVDSLDREGRTALFYAAGDGALTIAAELIRHGADVNVQDKSQKTPLHFAARAYKVEVAKLLLSSGASVDSQDAHGNTPLSDAVFDSKGRGDMIKLLCSFGADKTINNKHGMSPESLAASIGNYDVKQFLKK